MTKQINAHNSSPDFAELQRRLAQAILDVDLGAMVGSKKPEPRHIHSGPINYLASCLRGQRLKSIADEIIDLPVKDLEPILLMSAYEFMDEKDETTRAVLMTRIACASLRILQAENRT